VEVRSRSASLKRVQEALAMASRTRSPRWLEVDPAKARAVVKSLPEAEDLRDLIPEAETEGKPAIRQELIVEIYSK